MRNKTFYYGDYCELALYNRAKKEIARTKFSPDKLELVKKYRWSLNGDNVLTGTGKKRIRLQQLILGKKPGFEIDHINHDRLDNRNQNLRFVTPSQNMMNRRNVKGYYWDKIRRKYVAYICKNYKIKYLGGYVYKENAIKARKEAEKILFGNYAYDY